MSSNAVTRVTPREQGEQITALLETRAEQLRSLLGADERTYERFRTVALHAITTDPKVLACEPASIIEAVRDSATLGLEPNGLLGDGYVIAYGTQAQFQVGYRGLLKLARRSREIASIDAQVVYEADVFDMELGSEPRITHRPALEERGNRVGVYGFARLTSGELVPEWMTNAEIELVRRASRASRSGPWVDWPDEMARKTVIKRLCKRLPLDPLAEQALEIEARADNLPAAEPAATTVRLAGSTARERVQARLLPTSDGRDHGDPSRSEEGARPEGTDGSSSPVTSAGAGADSSPGPASDPDPGPDPNGSMPALTDSAGEGHPPPTQTPAGSAPCEGFHEELGRCMRTDGHKGNHSNKDRETWR